MRSATDLQQSDPGGTYRIVMTYATVSSMLMEYLVRNCFLHFLTRNDLPGVGHLTVRTGMYLVTDGILNVHKYCTRCVFARACLGKNVTNESLTLPMARSPGTVLSN